MFNLLIRKRAFILVFFLLILVGTNFITYFVSAPRESINENSSGTRESKRWTSVLGSMAQNELPSNKVWNNDRSASADSQKQTDSVAQKPLPRLADGSGKLSSAAAEMANLTQKEQDKVQEVISSVWEAAEISVAARAKFDTVRSNPEKGIRAYNIPAAPDRGKSLLADLQSKLATAVGINKSTKLYKALDTTEAFGGFGQFDVRLEFHSSPSQGGGGGEVVKFIYISPASGETGSNGEMTFEKFKEYFGSSFVLPDSK